SVAQKMAIASLADETELARRIEDNAQQRQRLQEAFDRLAISYAPSQTNFVWIQADRAQEVFDALLKKGIIVRSFGGGNALRVGIGSEDETSRIIEAFEKLKAEQLI
ncbi:MAG: aminotransferase class I/II-fold pyridoxal phosphate-dependent enzyme, partial [Coriobacteriia bacterium]|nr:aminotransferase class I/II-fold pyridoxal phosphate-dependent enzyme [Coriobacteriia bacterium]